MGIPNKDILQKENDLTINGAHKVTMKPRRRKMKKILERRDSKYLIEWENCSKEETSWELRSAIPSNILDSFDEHLVPQGKKDTKREAAEQKQNYKQHTVQINNLPQNESCGTSKLMKIGNGEKQLPSKKKEIRAHIDDLPKQDNFYLIESLLKKKGSKYQVKWNTTQKNRVHGNQNPLFLRKLLKILKWKGYHQNLTIMPRRILSQ